MQDLLMSVGVVLFQLLPITKKKKSTFLDKIVQEKHAYSSDLKTYYIFVSMTTSY